MKLPVARHYRFGSSRLASHIPLTVLPELAADKADITLNVVPASRNPAPVSEWRHHWPAPNGAVALSLAIHGNGYRLRFPDLCDFVIDADASNVQAEPAAGLDLHTLEHVIVDQLMPRALAHKGTLVAHASVMTHMEGAFSFLGHSGWGKSTLASLLHGAGHTLLSDDCALLVPTSDMIGVIPTYPGLRMFDDSIRRASADAIETTAVAAYSLKQRLRLPCDKARVAQHAWPLRAIYLLNDPATRECGHDIAPVTPTQACMALVEHSFRLDVASNRHTTELLRQAAAIALKVPAFSLRYPRDYNGNRALLDMLTTHMTRLASASLCL